VDEAAAAMTGEVVTGDGSAFWQGAALDSRKVQGGELFFALRGAATDGHRFVPQALASGAAAAVVDRDLELAALPPGGTLVRVADAYEGLHALTRAIRLEVPRHVVGITGSTGKTTTKELLGAVLGRRFRTAKSPGNLNNLYGFPLALLSVPDGTEWMVAEMGMSTPGELRGVSLLGRPDVAVYTNVRPVHLEFFGDVRTIAEAKAELLAGLAPGGVNVAQPHPAEVSRHAARDRRRGGGL
jgi:UDP-N-acetylmuramoyl-tripeptide--D-alanyl-D-alanine ligase